MAHFGICMLGGAPDMEFALEYPARLVCHDAFDSLAASFHAVIWAVATRTQSSGSL